MNGDGDPDTPDGCEGSSYRLSIWTDPISGNASWSDSDFYFRGVVAGSAGLAAWTSCQGSTVDHDAYNLYLDVTSSSFTSASMATSVTSYAAPAVHEDEGAFGLVTSSGYTECEEGLQEDPPFGYCVFSAAEGGEDSSWLATGNGAYQVTTDPLSGLYYLLDANSRVWAVDQGDVRLTNTLCGSGGSKTIQPVLIAAKKPWVFGLVVDGTVYELNRSSSCWTPLLSGTRFLSIATDNGVNADESACGSGGSIQVWASDAEGGIWYFQ
jgi:hypothetical protein